ncbi:hypothetical protein LIER_32574 [Lithospermum erythrorhizon]|uniref:Uncharacterized protein n=1 Tax=Lithospermum erythrorhizon TaxID=34254 RepID=A0AAV3RU76_LITER
MDSRVGYVLSSIEGVSEVSTAIGAAYGEGCPTTISGRLVVSTKQCPRPERGEGAEAGVVRYTHGSTEEAPELVNLVAAAEPRVWLLYVADFRVGYTQWTFTRQMLRRLDHPYPHQANQGMD